MQTIDVMRSVDSPQEFKHLVRTLVYGYDVCDQKVSFFLGGVKTIGEMIPHPPTILCF